MAKKPQGPNVLRVDANPTKDFFISMLVKDIELTRSILDLVDNSIDGARRLRGRRSFKGLKTSITATSASFEISDNCGGIKQKVAEEYAFRFGRPPGMTTVKHSVGQFGVGMKRALFKLGTHFKVESTTGDGSFSVEVDVPTWKLEDDWKFVLQPARNKLVPPTGTKIHVAPLHASVSEDFGLEAFTNRLKRELEAAHSESLINGLAISLNGVPLEAREPTLLRSKRIKPVFRQSTHIDPSEKDRRVAKRVTVRLYAGIGRATDPKADPREAGWYIYCNGRLVLGPDQTAVTGWGTSSIPKYHNQFARFRGFVYFDCDDASRLPWNTTKTGVDTESAIYRTVQREMIVATRPVIDFLNNLDREARTETSSSPLTREVERAKAVSLKQVRHSQVFSGPTSRATERKQTKISYSKPTDQADRVKKKLKARNYRDVGEQTFDYYYRFEIKGQ